MPDDTFVYRYPPFPVTMQHSVWKRMGLVSEGAYLYE